MKLSIKKAETTDIPILAEMNKQLIEDENSENPMNLQELEQRMEGWLKEDWRAELLQLNEQTIGYALYQFREAPFHQGQQVVYVRQYFIRRSCRNQDYGRALFEMLQEQRFKDAADVMIDVLTANPKGQRFWEKVGFKPYYTNMRKNPSGK